jgi:hypothetical protein
MTRRLYRAQVILRPHAQCPQRIDQRYAQCVGYLMAYCTEVAELAGGADA